MALFEYFIIMGLLTTSRFAHQNLHPLSPQLQGRHSHCTCSPNPASDNSATYNPPPAAAPVPSIPSPMISPAPAHEGVSPAAAGPASEPSASLLHHPLLHSRQQGLHFLDYSCGYICGHGHDCLKQGKEEDGGTWKKKTLTRRESLKNKDEEEDDR